MSKLMGSTLEESGELAHEQSVEPIGCNGTAHSHWHTYQCYHQICHGKVNQEIVGDAAMQFSSVQFNLIHLHIHSLSYVVIFVYSVTGFNSKLFSIFNQSIY